MLEGVYVARSALLLCRVRAQLPGARRTVPPSRKWGWRLRSSAAVPTPAARTPSRHGGTAGGYQRRRSSARPDAPGRPKQRPRRLPKLLSAPGFDPRKMGTFCTYRCPKPCNPSNPRFSMYRPIIRMALRLAMERPDALPPSHPGPRMQNAPETCSAVRALLQDRQITASHLFALVVFPESASSCFS